MIDKTTPRALTNVLDQLEEWPATNVSAAVLRGGSEVETVGTWGDTSHVFELKSVSKLLTAYSVLIAVEEGAFELDDQVPATVASNFDTPPTIRELLAHASGVGFQEHAPEKPARTRRIYSSAGFEMLAETITKLTEIPFEEYAAEALNEPLGMNVVFEGSAGHGFSASVDDLTRFAVELLSPTLVSQTALTAAWTIQYPELDGIVPGYGMQKPCPWGLGFEIHGLKSPHWMGTSMPENVVGHFGQSGTFLWVHPDTKKAAVVLTDENFGDWAKTRWDSFNDSLWSALS